MSIQDFRPGDDLDHDGLSNLAEYLAGTYASDPKDGFALNLTAYNGGSPVVEFMGIRGRTYSILSSTDMAQWSPVAFKTAGASEPAATEYYASDVRILRMEIPRAETQAAAVRFFKLMVR